MAAIEWLSQWLSLGLIKGRMADMTRDEEFRLPGNPIPVGASKSNELAGQTGYMMVTRGPGKPEVYPVWFESESERVRREARDRLATKRARRAEGVRYLAVWEMTTGPLRAVVELHHPNRHGECEGCDPGTYGGERAEWPCATWETIERAT